MKKDIKDYLYLHLGCEVELDNGGSRVIKKLIAVGGVDDGDFQYCKLRLGSAEKGHVHAVLLKENRVKPILRPLSDACMQEKADAKKLILLDKWGQQTVESMAGVTRYLISKDFDVFGLIEAGLAIDKTKILTPTSQV